MKVAIITAIYDKYDGLKSPLPQEGVDAEWVCVTDERNIASDYMDWQIHYRPIPDMHPNRAAKFPKYLPWQYTDADYSIWIDASFRVKSPTFARDVLWYVNTRKGHSPIAQFRHPWRDCAYAEALESARLPKYHGEPVHEQARDYDSRGFPKNWGLWATGVIVRKHTQDVKNLGEYWMTETNLWTFQDQISEPYALWKVGLRPNELPGTHFANPWLTYEGSGRH